MASPAQRAVEDARDATRIATDFLKQWYAFIRPKSAKRLGNNWVVEIDVGVFLVEIASVTIEAMTGRVIGYDRP